MTGQENVRPSPGLQQQWRDRPPEISWAAGRPPDAAQSRGAARTLRMPGVDWRRRPSPGHPAGDGPVPDTTCDPAGWRAPASRRLASGARPPPTSSAGLFRSCRRSRVLEGRPRAAGRPESPRRLAATGLGPDRAGPPPAADRAAPAGGGARPRGALRSAPRSPGARATGPADARERRREENGQPEERRRDGAEIDPPPSREHQVSAQRGPGPPHPLGGPALPGRRREAGRARRRRSLPWRRRRTWLMPPGLPCPRPRHRPPRPSGTPSAGV